MSAVTTVLIFSPTSTITTAAGTNITQSYVPKLNTPKTDSTLLFPSSKLLSSGKSLSSLHRSGRSRNTMSGSITTCANRVGDEGPAAAFEQDSLINGFRPNPRAEGLEATVNRLSKWLLSALFGAVLIWRHDTEALWAAMGSVINIGLSTVLKRVLNQERPVSNLRSDPGMPSSHAQAIFFTVIFVVVSLFQWQGVRVLTMTLSVLALAFGSYLSWLRVSQQLHTVSQVVVGAVVGSAFSILWFWSWDVIVFEAFISYLWVRIFIILGATIFCVGFLIHVVRHWVTDW